MKSIGNTKERQFHNACMLMTLQPAAPAVWRRILGGRAVCTFGAGIPHVNILWCLIHVFLLILLVALADALVFLLAPLLAVSPACGIAGMANGDNQGFSRMSSDPSSATFCLIVLFLALAAAVILLVAWLTPVMHDMPHCTGGDC